MAFEMHESDARSIRIMAKIGVIFGLVPVMNTCFLEFSVQRAPSESSLKER
jgi:hypothetical protein